MTAVIIFFYLLFVCFNTTPAFGYGKSKKVVLLIIERLELTDISNKNAPNLARMISEEGAGLTAFRKAYAYNDVESAFYATIGAGSTSVGLETGGTYFQPRKWNKSDNDLKHIADRINRLNKDNRTLANFGALGEALHANGLKTAALNNILSGNPTFKYFNILMDDKGRIDYINNINNSSTEAATNTDQARLKKNFESLYDKSDLITVYFGRLNHNNKDKKISQYNREKIIHKIDREIGQILKKINQNDLLITIMPFSSTNLNYGVSGSTITKGEPLSPIIIKGPSYKGLLRTNSTRRLGIVTAPDILPTILKFLNIKTNIRHTGDLIQSEVFANNKIDFLKNFQEKSIRHDAFMIPILFFIIIFGLVTITLSLIFITTGYENKLNDILRILLIATILSPTAVLLLALFNFKPLWQNLAFIIGLIILTAPLAALIKNRLKALILTLSLLPLIILVDTLNSQTIINNSFFGNSLLAGGRYYGLGNQYMGLIFIYIVLLFITVGLLSPYLVKNRFFRIIMALVFFILILIIGLPSLGANFGGLITLGISLPYLYIKLISKTKPKSITYLALIFFSSIIIISGIIYDLLQNPLNMSHIGRFFVSVHNHGTGIAATIFKRKLLKNIEETSMILIKWKGAVVILALTALFYKSREKLANILDTFPLFKRSLSGIGLTALIALIVNDTGFEPFAIIILYTLVVFLYLGFCLNIPDGDENSPG